CIRRCNADAKPAVMACETGCQRILKSALRAAGELLAELLHHTLHFRLHLTELLRIDALRQVLEDILEVRGSRSIFLDLVFLGFLLRFAFLFFLLRLIAGRGRQAEAGESDSQTHQARRPNEPTGMKKSLHDSHLQNRNVRSQYVGWRLEIEHGIRL